jgi:hypothetical protein
LTVILFTLLQGTFRQSFVPIFNFYIFIIKQTYSINM